MGLEWKKPKGLDSDLGVLWRKTARFASKTVTPLKVFKWLMSKAARPTREQLVTLVFLDWLAEQRRLECPIVDLASPDLILKPGCELPPDHYIVRVRYEPLPREDDLSVEFGGRVSAVYDGRAWNIDESCRGIDRTSGHRLFWDADPPAEVGRRKNDLIAWAGRQRTKIAPFGWRPATHLEAYDFLRRTRTQEFCIRWRIALGSYTYYRQGPFYAAVAYEPYGCLGHVCWNEECGDWTFEGSRILLIARRPGETYDGIRIAA